MGLYQRQSTQVEKRLPGKTKDRVFVPYTAKKITGYLIPGLASTITNMG